MPRPLTFAFLLSLAILTPLRALAWNSIGHLASAKLAYDRLDEQDKAALFTLLKANPHYKEFLAAGRPADVDEREWVILRASVWPDWVRGRRDDPRGQSVTRYNRPEEHYTDIPLVDPKDEAAFAGKTLVPPDQSDILCALRHESGILHSRTAADEDKAIAICWIFHLIGDIHMPLHNTSYFSSEPGLEHGDQGGNKFAVKIEGRVWKLHPYWDDLLGEDSNYSNDTPEHQKELFQTAMKAADRLGKLELPAEAAERLAKNRTFASWSREGYELAKKVAYQSADGSGILKHVVVQQGEPFPEDAPEAGAKYAEKAHAVADVQVALAGRRLADRIHDLLKAEP
jgi:hypothetical protein